MLYRFGYLLCFVIAPSYEDDLFRAEDSADTYRDGTYGYSLCRTEQIAGVSAGVVVQQHQTRLAVELRTGFVEGDVAATTDTQQHQVYTSQLLDRALISRAGVDDLFLGESALDSNHVGGKDTHLRDELLLELTEATCIFLRQRIVLISHYQHYVAEAQSAFVQTYELGEDILHRTTGHHAQNELLAFLLTLRDQIGDVCRYGTCTFFACFVNTCLHFLHPAHAGQLEDIIGFVQFSRYPTQRDL